MGFFLASMLFRNFAVTANYAALTRMFHRITESIALTPEPVSLALFGAGLTLVGVAFLRSSRQTKWSKTARRVHNAVDRSYVRLSRNAKVAHYPLPNFPAHDRFAAS